MRKVTGESAEGGQDQSWAEWIREFVAPWDLPQDGPAPEACEFMREDGYVRHYLRPLNDPAAAALETRRLEREVRMCRLFAERLCEDSFR